MFKERVRVDFKESGARQYAKLCLMFPGQGRILPETYTSYFDIPTVREVFHEADELASKRGLPPISGLIFKDLAGDGAKEEISGQRVLLLNLFQLTISTALFRYLLLSGRKPDFLTAHSFGEYGALHCASVYDFETAFDIVRIREECSPVPGELGTLVAVSASRTEIEKLTSLPEYHIANINSPKQIVLAVPQKGLKGFLYALRKERIAAKELQSVARPYHSPMLKENTEAFFQKLSALKIVPRPLSHRFVSSVGGIVFEKGFLFSEENLKRHLAGQFVVPVDFEAQARKLREMGNFGYLELSSVPVLRDFIMQSFGDAADFHTTYFGDYLSRKQEKTGGSTQKFEIKDSRLMSSVLGFVSKITGYDIREISVNHRFEDDLRIDSIKKAEILFRSLEENKLESETGLELSKLRHVGDLVSYIETRKSQKSNAPKEEEAQFELAEEAWTPAPRPQALATAEFDFERVSVASLKDQTSFRKAHIVLDLSSGWPGDLVELSQHLHRLLKETTREFPVKQILVMTRERDSLFSAIWAFLLSLRKEEFGFRLKGFLSAADVSDASLLEELRNPLSQEVSLGTQGRLTKTLRKLSVGAAMTSHELERKILSIGGSSGILKHYFSNTQALGRARLILVGRSSANSEKVTEVLPALKERFQSVDYFQCDMTDSESVQRLLKHLSEISFRPDFVFDGSGSEVSRLYKEKSADEKKSEFLSKTLALQNLETIFERLALKRSRYIQFNSITSRYGNAGQTIYGMGDGQSLAKAVSHVVWPAVHRLGMTENLGILQKLLSMGVDLLPQNKVVEFLDQIVQVLTSSEEPRTFEIVSLKDRLILQLQMLDEEWVRRVLGEVEIRPSLRVKKNLDPEKQVFLKDHIISGRCIVPGCYGFASMYLLAQIYFNQPPQVSEFHLKSLIPLDSGPVDTFLNVKPRSLQSLSLSVSSRVENYLADFECVPVSVSKPRETRLRVVYDMEMKDFYSTKYVYHGATFRVLNRIQITEDGRCVSEFISNGQSPMSESEDFDHIAKMIESVFQTAGFLATWHDFVSLVPTSIGKIRHHSGRKTEKWTLITSPLRRKTEPDRWITDVEVYNADGEVLMSFDEVTGMKIKKYSSFPVDHKEITGSEKQWIVT